MNFVVDCVVGSIIAVNWYLLFYSLYSSYHSLSKKNILKILIVGAILGFLLFGKLKNQYKTIIYTCLFVSCFQQLSSILWFIIQSIKKKNFEDLDQLMKTIWNQCTFEEELSEPIVTFEEEFKIIDPLTALTPEQQQLLNELRNKIIINDENFLTDYTLFRFLQGNNWILNDAMIKLNKAIEWRKQFKPEKITFKDIEKVAKQGYIFHAGFDRQYRPCIYIFLGRDKLENTEENANLKVIF